MAGGAASMTAAANPARIAVLMKTGIIVGLAALALGVAASFAFLRGGNAAAPEVRFATLSGNSFATSDLRGKVVLVNFWATSCVVCVKEMPRMVETYKKYAPRGYEMVAVAMSYDHPNQVAAFATSRGLPFQVALDADGAIAKSFGDIRVTPTTFVLDKRGRVLKRYLGEPDWAEFHQLLDKALGDPA
jgi:peroxiredoxin